MENMTDSFQDETGRTRQTLGHLLKEARKSKKKSLADISAATGIGLSKLQALESGDRRGLPADVFVRGFIRMFAAQVDADPQVALELYESEWGGNSYSSGDDTSILQGEVFAKSSLLLRHWPAMLTTLVLCIIIYLITKFFFPALFVDPTQPIRETLSDELPKVEIITNQKNSEISTVIAQGVEILEQEFSDTVDADHVILSKPENPAHKSPDQSQSENENSATDSSTSAPEKQSLEATSSTSTDISGALPAEDTLPDQEATEQVPHYTLHLKFTERTWIKISIDGLEPQEEIFKQNSEKTWEADKSIDLYLGNAGGVEIDLNGEPMPLTQESGQTVRLKIP